MYYNYDGQNQSKNTHKTHANVIIINIGVFPYFDYGFSVSVCLSLDVLMATQTYWTNSL